ncbi:MAG TPA: hypothetical protein PKA95_13875 [Thermomicrobiales bacterium]|nr:hypothetical protein [Thermomicrobiales bacterium]
MARRAGGGRPATWPAWLFRTGLLVVALGAAGDVIHHALPPIAAPMALLLGHEGERAHLVTLVGMVLIVVALAGIESRRRTATNQRGRRAASAPASAEGE